jgi:peroxiredoxin
MKQTPVFLIFILFSVNILYSQNYLEKNLLKKDNIAPVFSLLTASGDSINLSDYKGKVVILDFWYVGCSPCVKAYRDIKALEEKLGKDKFVIIGMNPVTRKNKILRYIKKGKYNDTVAICSKTIRDQYKVKAYPTIYVISKQGKIALATAGYYNELKSKIEKVVKEESKKGGVKIFL